MTAAMKLKDACSLEEKLWPTSVKSLNPVRLFVTPWISAHQASLSITDYQSLLKLMSVVPDIRIPEREERRLPRQCNWQKGEAYYWLEPGPSAASNEVVQVREPLAPAVTQIYRVSTRLWFKQIGYKFAKQFHWSKLLCGRDFPEGFRPFLIS